MSGYDITSVVDMYLSNNPEPAAIRGTIVAALDPDPRSDAAALLELSEKLIDQLHPEELDLWDGRSSTMAASSACPIVRPSTRRRSPSTPPSM